MVDRPVVADPRWLAELEEVFGPSQLTVMSAGGERGLVCQMHIAPESAQHVRRLAHPLAAGITQMLLPLVHEPPAVTLALAWDTASGSWVSQIWQGGYP